MSLTPDAVNAAILNLTPAAPHAVLLGSAALIQIPWPPPLPSEFDGNTLLWQFLFGLLGLLTAWLAVRQLRERRRLKEVESKAEQAKAESEQQAQQIGAIRALAASVTEMSRAQVARAEAQDRERTTWRETIEAQGAQIAAMIAGGMQMSDAVNHQARALDGLKDGLKDGAEKVVSGVNRHVDAGLDDLKDAVATIWDTVTSVQQDVAAHRAHESDVVARLDAVLLIAQQLKQRLEAQPPKTEPPEEAPEPEPVGAVEEKPDEQD